MFRVKYDRATFTTLALSALALSPMGGCQNELEDSPEGPVTTASQELRNGPAPLRDFIARQVGGLEKLKVPADDATIPLPPEDPSRPGRYKTTEAKRFLGKLLFHDPVRRGSRRPREAHRRWRPPRRGQLPPLRGVPAAAPRTDASADNSSAW